MKSKTIVFLTIFILVLVIPVVVSAMGERQNYATGDVCDTSDKVKEFVLSSRDGTIKEVFTLPIRYMNMKFERDGRIDSTLHVAATLDSLEPQCKSDGSLASKEEILTLKIVASPTTENWVSSLRENYADTEKYQGIEINGYPDFTFKASKNRPEAIKNSTVGYTYIPVYPNERIAITEDFFVVCELFSDMQKLNVCQMRFSYKDNLAVTATFAAGQLQSLQKVHADSVALLKKFHTH